jgi:hypothetical protein
MRDCMQKMTKKRQQRKEIESRFRVSASQETTVLAIKRQEGNLMLLHPFHISYSTIILTTTNIERRVSLSKTWVTPTASPARLLEWANTFWFGIFCRLSSRESFLILALCCLSLSGCTIGNVVNQRGDAVEYSGAIRREVPLIIQLINRAPVRAFLLWSLAGVVTTKVHYTVIHVSASCSDRQSRDIILVALCASDSLGFICY